MVVAAQAGVDLSAHASQPLSNRLLDQADHIFTMTRSHREAILLERPDLAARVQLLARSGEDISDPIGGGPAEYEQCIAEIGKHLRVLVAEIEEARRAGYLR